MISDVKNYLNGNPKLHKETSYLHGHFLKEYLKCKTLGHLYNMTWEFQTYELELNHLVRINRLDNEKIQNEVNRLLDKHKNCDNTLDKILEEIVDCFNVIEEYEVFEHWKK